MKVATSFFKRLICVHVFHFESNLTQCNVFILTPIWRNTLFPLSFIMNDQNRLSVMLTNVLSPCLVLFSPLYILFLSPYFDLLTAIHHWSRQLFLPVCTWERERKKDNFICTKYEHLRNTQWWCHLLSIPLPVSPLVTNFWYPLPLPWWCPFWTAPKERPF